MVTIDDIKNEADRLSPSSIRSRLQSVSENIDITQQKMKKLDPKRYGSIKDYDAEVARLNAHIAEFREQRTLYQELLRTNGHYEE